MRRALLLLVSWCGLIVTVAPLTAVAQLPAQTPEPPAVTARADCSQVLLVGVRGSGQNPGKDTYAAGYGIQSLGVINKVKTKVNAAGLSTVPMPLLPEKYPATDVKEIGRDRSTARYMEGVAVGARSLAKLLRDQHAACPDQIFVLSGYSQGAMVIHRGLLELKARGDAGVMYRIAGAVLLADGHRFKNTRANQVGSAGSDGIGIGQVVGQQYQPDVPRAVSSRTWSVCQRDDPVCGWQGWAHGLKNFGVHTNDYYFNAKVITEVVDAVVEQVRRLAVVPANGTPSAMFTNEQVADNDRLLKVVWPIRCAGVSDQRIYEQFATLILPRDAQTYARDWTVEAPYAYPAAGNCENRQYGIAWRSSDASNPETRGDRYCVARRVAREVSGRPGAFTDWAGACAHIANGTAVLSVPEELPAS